MSKPKQPTNRVGIRILKPTRPVAVPVQALVWDGCRESSGSEQHGTLRPVVIRVAIPESSN